MIISGGSSLCSQPGKSEAVSDFAYAARSLALHWVKRVAINVARMNRTMWKSHRYTHAYTGTCMSHIGLYSLRGQGDRVAGRLAVHKLRAEIEEQVDNQRTCIFGQEHGLPANLRSQIPQVDLIAIAQVKGFHWIRILEALATRLQTAVIKYENIKFDTIIWGRGTKGVCMCVCVYLQRYAVCMRRLLQRLVNRNTQLTDWDRRSRHIHLSKGLARFCI